MKFQPLSAGLLALAFFALPAGAATTVAPQEDSNPSGMAAFGLGADGSVIFNGATARDDSWYAHFGYLQDLDNDLTTPGWFFRAFSGIGQYEYTRGIGGSITGTLIDLDGGLGYRHFAGDWIIGLYSGLHFRDRDLDRNEPSNNPEGTDWGARLVLDADGSTGIIHWNGIAQFSTINDSWWTRARAGFDIGRFRVGPEYIWLTDEQFEEYRVGAFVSTQINPELGLTLSLGYADYTAQHGRSAGTDDSSLYGSFGLSFTF